MGKYTCPNCESENTRLVSQVFAEGYSTGQRTKQEYVGDNVEYTTKVYEDGHKETKETNRTRVYEMVTRPTYSISELARDVAPPLPPPQPVPHQVNGDAGLIGCMGIGCGIPFALVASLVLLPKEIKSIPNIYPYIAVAVVLIVVASIIQNKHDTRKENERLKQQFNQEYLEYQKQYAKYQQRYSEWEHTYICLRCNSRFQVNDD